MTRRPSSSSPRSTSTTSCFAPSRPAPAGSCSRTRRPWSCSRRSASSPPVTRRLIAHFAAADPHSTREQQARARLDGLTEREVEVLAAVGRGQSNAEIGTELFMSEATVKAYVSRLLTKLDLNNRVQLAILAHDATLDVT